MSITPTYPGIYIQELPNSSHTITAAPTSVAVFVGYTHPFKTNPATFGVPVEIFSFSDYEAQFGGFFPSKLIDGNVARAVNDFFLNGGAHAYVVSTNGKPSDATSTLTYSLSDGGDQAPSGALAVRVTQAETEFGPGILFKAIEPIDQVPMSITLNSADGSSADITIAYGSRSETFRKLTLDKAAPKFLDNAINGLSSLVTVEPTIAPNYPASFPVGLNTQTFVTPAAAAVPATAKGVFHVTDFDEVFAEDRPLDKLPVFNLMAIPGIVNIGVLSEALAFCERKHAFFIMDPPRGDQADNLPGKHWIGDFIQLGDPAGNVAPKSQNGALYFPYVKSIDALTGDSISSPPSGFVAGIYARTDTNRGVWKAPAGLETSILGTSGVVDSGRMTDNRQGSLNPIGVNCLRSFPTGTVVFGARTLVGQDTNKAFEQWKYVPVRRMALFIEQTLLQNLRWVIFEPNDNPLWVSIRTSIDNFMLGLFSQGAFQGATPSQAFQVKCDSSTTTQSDIDNGIVNIVIAFAPLKPAEFVIIKIAQLAGQAQQ